MKKIFLTFGILLSTSLLAACGGQSGTTDTTSSTTMDSGMTSSTEMSSGMDSGMSDSMSGMTGQADQSDQTGQDTTVAVSINEAIRKFKAEYADTEITSLDLERNGAGRYEYKIEGVDDTSEHEATVNAQSGELRKGSTEMLDNDEQNGQKKQEDGIDTDGLKPVDEITKAAEEAAGQGTAEEWSLDKSNGKVVWEVKVQGDGQRHEVEVDAKTGEVLNTSKDD